MSGPPPWASSPFSSARVFRDQRDDQGVDQPSYPVARVWPISKLCKGGPAAPAFGGYGLDRACCPATVSHHGIDDDVRLIKKPLRFNLHRGLLHKISDIPARPTDDHVYDLLVFFISVASEPL